MIRKQCVRDNFFYQWTSIDKDVEKSVNVISLWFENWFFFTPIAYQLCIQKLLTYYVWWFHQDFINEDEVKKKRKSNYKLVNT